MTLVKYKDNYDPTYSYFWTHDLYRDGRELVVSPVFQTEEAAFQWATDLKEPNAKS